VNAWRSLIDDERGNVSGQVARTSAAIEVRGLDVTRGGAVVVQDLSFQVAPGEIVGLLGPSGCGKSSLMRALVGVQLGVTGVCSVLGLPAGSKSLRTKVGYMTQEASVYVDLTVVENLRYFAAVGGASRSRAETVIDEVDLRSQRDRLVGSLSGGQRNRVSLAAALLAEPRVLILDEPTVGLDPVLRKDLWTRFRELAAAGVTLLVSSHVMAEASECDRIVMMRDGRLLADATLDELLTQTGTSNITHAFLALVETVSGTDGQHSDG
jgi:ABC-2 type transport system ATP-binding protein